jgi:hypothetical protein
MAKQAIWAGIAIGVFFAGLGIGYAVFSSNVTTMGQVQRHQMMSQMISDPQAMTEFMNQMMDNPQAMQRMHEAMIKDPKHMEMMHQIMADNPQYMQQMMNDAEHMKLMHQMMMNNPDHMQQMMGQMMMDPATLDQMHGMMFNDPQHMQQMQQMMGNWTGTTGVMGSGWAGPMMGTGMMGQGMMTGPMMGSPITKETDVIKTIDNIEDLLDQVSSKYNDGDPSGALLLATEAYLENYEYIEGAVASKDIALMEKVELMLRRDLRHAINTEQPVDDVDAKIDSIREELQKIRTLFQ